MTDVRIHIGNISPKLAESQQALITRLSKFGTITKELELHSKPLQDHFYAFVSIKLEEGGFEKLKSALNGILFMGLKLSIGLAKPSFEEAWKKDAERPDTRRVRRVKQEQVTRARDARIREATTTSHVNSVTGTLIAPKQLPGTDGYMKSSHMFNNMSGNTKNKPPSRSLIGTMSYGTWIQARPQPHLQAYSKTSGGGEIIKGRLRKTPRSAQALKHQTLRVLINGELKTFKCYKTKLWGVENKKVSELTWRNADGAWWSGDDHIIERNVTRSVRINDPIIGGPGLVKCGIDQEGAQSYGRNLGTDGHTNEDIDFAHEELKNKSILASILDHHDFDKPVELEDNGIDKEDIIVDKYGRRKAVRYDYEMEGGLESEDETKVMDVSSVEQILNKHRDDFKPQQEVYYDEDDSGNELDMETLKPTYPIEEEPKEGKTQVEQSDSEDEFMPTFGAPASASTTETLRTLFNPEEKAEPSFKLALSEDDDDVDNDAQVDAEQQQQLLQQIKQKQLEDSLREHSNKYGLFWTHSDSPFLQTQTHLNKIGVVGDVKLPGEAELAGNDNEETPYEKWFWKVRGEFSRECKRRKRDVQRIFKKKSSRTTII